MFAVIMLHMQILQEVLSPANRFVFRQSSENLEIFIPIGYIISITVMKQVMAELEIVGDKRYE